MVLSLEKSKVECKSQTLTSAYYTSNDIQYLGFYMILEYIYEISNT